jgi:hypothetical protein
LRRRRGGQARNDRFFLTDLSFVDNFDDAPNVSDDLDILNDSCDHNVNSGLVGAISDRPPW